MKRKAILLIGILVALVTILANAQNSEEPSITTKKLSDNLYVLYGGDGQGSNIGVLIGSDGILLIDAMKADSHVKIMHRIRQFSSKPIKYVINTHSDNDHTGGNEQFRALGAKIILQENAKYAGVDGDDYFNDRFTMTFDSETIVIEAVVSHSFSDAIIHFKENNVVFMGDTFTNTWHPTFYSGGIAGQHKAVTIAKKLGNDQSKIVPGHGFIDNSKGLLRYKRNTDLALARIMMLYQQQGSIEKILQDDEFNELLITFNANHKTDPIPPINKRRFVERVISTELTKCIQLDSEQLKGIEGKYVYDDESVDQIIINENKPFLIKQSPYQYMAELIPVSENRFHIRGSIDGYMEFAFDHKTLNLTYQNSEEAHLARRLAKD